jgi:hypothetical protein
MTMPVDLCEMSCEINNAKTALDLASPEKRVYLGEKAKGV